MVFELDLIKNKLYKSDIERVVKTFDFSPFRKSKILITGGLGLICSSVVDCFIVANQLFGLNIQILVADINEELFFKKYKEYGFISFVKYDAKNNFSFEQNFDYILIGAGIANPSFYLDMPVDTMLSNINGLINILNENRNSVVKKIIYISSSEVYGIKENENPFVENVYGKIDFDSIRSSYAVAKIACELLCKSYFKQHSLPLCIVRPGHIFGPAASPKDKRLSSDFCFKAARGEELCIHGTGRQIRSYCYSLDCALAILYVFAKGVSCESYNIGSSESTSIKELSTFISSHSNVKLTILNNENTIVSNPMNNSCVNISKLQLLGFKNLFTVQESIEHTIDIIKEVYKY